MLQESTQDKQNRMNNSFRPSSASLRGNKGNLPEPCEDLENYIDILYEHQKNCEKSGKYVEAEMAKKRLMELKKELDKRNKEDVKSRHFSEKGEIEKAHFGEFNEFNEFWDKKMDEFNQEADRVEQETLQKHDEELGKFAEELERSIPMKPKDNASLINLKKIEENLAKQEQYIEAHKVQQQVLQSEKEDYEKWLYQRNQKIKNLIGQLRTKQQNELNALRQRIESGQEEQRKIRSMELEKKELESSQNSEIQRIEKSIKNGSVMNNTSKMINSSKMINGSFMQRGGFRQM